MHQLCFICITSWKSKSCPLCRAPNAILESESGASLPTRSSATTTTMTEDEDEDEDEEEDDGRLRAIYLNRREFLLCL